MRAASRASIVAILAQRITEGAGRPAPSRSEITTSSFHLRFSALVIIRTHSNPCAASIGPAAMRSPGRCCRTGRSVYGDGTLTTSHGLKAVIGPPVILGGPFAERREWIISRRTRRLGYDHSTSLDLVGKLVAFAHAQRFAHGLGNGRLRLACDLAGDHCQPNR